MDVAIVCAAIDGRRLGGDSVVVIPNGYEERPPVERVTSTRPTVGLVGSFSYGPNIDAAKTLIEQVMPLVRSQVPEARLLLVGRYGDKLLPAGTPDWVEATGYVERVEPRLGQIDVMAVPIRYGGGTRIKILEALCHGIPLAAYSYAVQGIDVVPGAHAALSSTPEELAATIVTLLQRPDERGRLASAGRELFETHYRWSTIRAQAIERIDDLLKLRDRQPGIESSRSDDRTEDRPA